jgi:DNA-binding response OmpR family regulator
MRILVINPHAATAKLVRFVLNEAGHEVLLAERGGAAIDALAERELDALLLEVDLPDCDGREVCRELRSRQFDGPIIFLTSRQEQRDKLLAYKYGADDYMQEPFDPEELLARIDAVIRRYNHAVYQSFETTLRVGDAELSINDLTFQIEGRPPVLLTPTEMRVLECLMRNAGITLSRNLLIERTWGFDDFVDTNRVDVCIRRIRKKVERNPDMPEYVHTVRGVGYVFRSQPGKWPNGHHPHEAVPADSASI